MKKIVILTSKENFVWVSMGEIIPFLESEWMRTGKIHHRSVVCIDVDTVPLSKIMSKIIQSDLIVLSCFTMKIANIVSVARRTLDVSSPLVIYLHNMASIACWPYYKFGLGDYLTTNDIFVGSCSRDHAAIKRVFKNACVKIHPFSFNNLKEKTSLQIKKDNALVYIGRISPQKQLHTLFWSLALIKKQYPDMPWTLDIYGTEDHLGSPLMGIEENNYLSFLKDLAADLKIKNHLIFHGFKNRTVIEKSISRSRKIFVSPSLHSDENFGMAALRTLHHGHLALLSDWGGHHDFKKYFKDHVALLKVYKCKNGPFISPVDMSEKIIKLFRQPNMKKSLDLKYYKTGPRKVIHDIFNQHFSDKPHKLKLSKFAKKIHSRQKKFSKTNQNHLPLTHRGIRLFKSFNDPLSFFLFQDYGMKSKTKSWKQNQKGHFAPWVKCIKNQIEILDPHKGHYQLASKSANIPKWLYERGYFVRTHKGFYESKK